MMLYQAMLPRLSKRRGNNFGSATSGTCLTKQDSLEMGCFCLWHEEALLVMLKYFLCYHSFMMSSQKHFTALAIIVVAGLIVTKTVFSHVNLVLADSAPGGSSIGAPVQSASSSSPLGEQRLLAVIVDMSDATSTLSISDVNGIIFNPNSQFQKYYKTQSYGKTWFTGNVIRIHLDNRSVYDSKSSNNWPGMCGLGISLSDPDVLSAIEAQGIDVTKYSKILFVPRIGYCADGGMDYSIHGKIYSFSGVWVGWTLLASLDPELAHEVGHAFGLLHSNYWACDKNNSNCVSVEYGNHFDVMGYGSGDFNAIDKEKLGWLTPDDFVNITKTGNYSMNSLESASGKKAAKIVNPACPLETLYIERRQVGISQSFLPNDTLQNDGLLLNKLQFPRLKDGPTVLVDMNPGVPSYNFTDANKPYIDAYDVALRKGKQFSIKDLGITIGPVASISSSSENFYVDIHTPDISSLLPIIQGNFSKQTVQVGSVLQFGASVKNNDSICASSSTYILDFPNLPIGWMIDVPNSILTASNVIPQDIHATYVSTNILISSTTVPGIYPVTYRIRNIKSGVLATGTSSIEVQSSPSNPLSVATSSLSITTANPSNINVYKGKSYNVATYKLTASSSDMTLNRIILDFSDRIWLYADTLTISNENGPIGTIKLDASSTVMISSGSDYRVIAPVNNLIIKASQSKYITVNLSFSSGSTRCQLTSCVITILSAQTRATDTNGLTSHASTYGRVSFTYNSNLPISTTTPKPIPTATATYSPLPAISVVPVRVSPSPSLSTYYSPTPTYSSTPTYSVYPSYSPTPSVSVAPSPTVSVSPVVHSPSPSPSVSATPVYSTSPMPTSTPTPSVSPHAMSSDGASFVASVWQAVWNAVNEYTGHIKITSFRLLEPKTP